MKKFLIFCCCIMIGNVLCAAQPEKKSSHDQKKSNAPKKPHRKINRLSKDDIKKGDDYDQMQSQFAHIANIKEKSLNNVNSI